jgi:ribose 5-phosphate isomerase B
MNVVIGSDHAGFVLKGAVVSFFEQAGHRVVVQGRAELGIVIGGSGQGEAIAANKVHGARAALCHDARIEELSAIEAEEDAGPPVGG